MADENKITLTLEPKKEEETPVVEEEKNKLKKANENARDMFDIMKKVLENDNISDIKYTHRLKKHPVCLSSVGDISVGMEKVLNSLPNETRVNAKMVLEINDNHPIKEKLEDLYKNNKEDLEKYTKVLYSQARLIEGLHIENPVEISNLICEFLSK